MKTKYVDWVYVKVYNILIKINVWMPFAFSLL